MSMKLRIIYHKWTFGILMVGDAHPTSYIQVSLARHINYLLAKVCTTLPIGQN